jgi:hypothetical protein
MAVVLGVFPGLLLNYTNATIGGLAERLNPSRSSAPFLSESGANARPVNPQAATIETPRSSGEESLSSSLPLGEGQGVRAAPTSSRESRRSIDAPIAANVAPADIPNPSSNSKTSL